MGHELSESVGGWASVTSGEDGLCEVSADGEIGAATSDYMLPHVELGG